MKKVLTALAVAVSLSMATHAWSQTEKPTIVLVHGAFADASSWNGVVKILEKDGYPVVAAANPLRGVKSDGSAISALLTSIHSPVVLVVTRSSFWVVGVPTDTGLNTSQALLEPEFMQPPNEATVSSVAKPNVAEPIFMVNSLCPGQ